MNTKGISAKSHESHTCVIRSINTMESLTNSSSLGKGSVRYTFDF